MSTQLQLRRGTTVQTSTFTGGAGEITVDTTKKTVVVHDGVTAGGSPLVTESAIVSAVTSLGFTPYNSTNPSGYLSSISSGNITTALGFTPYNSTNPSGYITSITSGDVTTALGFTPYDSTNPTGYITSSGNAATATTATNLSGGTVAATTITATGNITAYFSDDRLKTNLGNISNALSKVKQLNGFYYEANETAQSLGYEPIREVGVSAQQVLAILPEITAPAPIDNQYLTVHYERLVPLLIEAIKELSAQVDKLGGTNGT